MYTEKLVCIRKEGNTVMSDSNYIHVMGFETEASLDKDSAKHIDSIAEEGDWEKSVQSMIDENKFRYFHISVESDDGKPLDSFNQ